VDTKRGIHHGHGQKNRKEKMASEKNYHLGVQRRDNLRTDRRIVLRTISLDQIKVVAYEEEVYEKEIYCCTFGLYVYFSILEDTLLGYFLPAYRPNIKVREQSHPKFYWFDSGVARAAAGLLFDPVDRLWKGTALETLIYHELRVYNHIQNKNRPICFYRTGSGAEIDFVIETQKRRQMSRAHIVCIEVKSAEKWQRKWEKTMRSLAKNDRIHVDKMFGIYTDNRTYHYDGINVLPVTDFLKRLHEGDVF